MTLLIGSLWQVTWDFGLILKGRQRPGCVVNIELLGMLWLAASRPRGQSTGATIQAAGSKCKKL